MGKSPIRKLSALFLTLILTLSAIFSNVGTTTVQASTVSGKWGKNVTWNYNTTNGTLIISGKGAMQDSLGQIEPICSKYKDKITKVVIKEGITAIGSRNFACYYFNLRTVVLPSTLEKIGDFAFVPHLSFFTSTGEEPPKYDKLETINLPQGLKTIGRAAFSDCTGLKQVKLPNTLTEIDAFTFFECDGLTSVDLPANINSIGLNAFGNSKNLSVVKIRNKNCEIYDADYTFSSGRTVTIYGLKGSTAERYAKKYSYRYKFKTLSVASTKTKISNIKITNAPKSLKAGKSIKLKTKITPAKATNKTVTWSSSNTRHATVNKYGKVTAKKAGKGKTVRITVKTKDGSKKKDTVKIKIK